MIKNLIGITFSLLALIALYAGIPYPFKEITLISLFIIQLFTFSIFETIRIRKERLARPSEHQPFSSYVQTGPDHNEPHTH